jgi:uncharacterized membrane protein YeaQ/YmgE (transglycosylase-associated protein family)
MSIRRPQLLRGFQRNAPGCQSVRFATPLSCNREIAVLDFGSIVTWIVIGGISGWMAGLIVEGYGFGLLGNIIVGIIGAAIAGLVTPLLGISIETKLGNIIAATLGAVVLLLLVGGLRRR